MNLARAFPSDSATQRRGDAVLALIAAGLRPTEIAALKVGDLRVFPTSVTVRLVRATGERYVRVRSFTAVGDLRCYLERDASPRLSSPLFPGRSPMRGMSKSRIYQLLDELREPSATDTAQESA